MKVKNIHEGFSITTVRVRPMHLDDAAEVWGVVQRSFDEFVAPDFPPEGVQEFYRYARPEALSQRLYGESSLLVAEQGGRILGVLEILACEHIAMLFVAEQGRFVETGPEQTENGITYIRMVLSFV